MHPDPLVADYLRRLEAAASGLPEERRAELIDEIRAHINDALRNAGATDEVTIRNVLERLGSPDDIATEAVGPAPQPASLNVGSRPDRLSIAALIVLAAGFIVPVFGWLAGAALVVASAAWSTSDKVVGLLLGIAAVVVVVMALTAAMDGSSLGPLELAVLSSGVAGLVSAPYLWWRLHVSRHPATSYSDA